MKIRELSINNYLSFSESGVNSDDFIKLSDFNLFIGRNNSGKSNIFKTISLFKQILFSISTLDDSSPTPLLDFRLQLNGFCSNFSDFFYMQQLNRKIEFSFKLCIEDNDREIVNLINNQQEEDIYNPALFMFRLDKNTYPKFIKLNGYIDYKRKNFYAHLNKVEIPTKHAAYKDKPLFDVANHIMIFLTNSSTRYREKVYKINRVPEDRWNKYFAKLDKSLRNVLSNLYRYSFNNLIVKIPAIRKINLFEHDFEDPQHESKEGAIKVLSQLRDGRREERNNFRIIKDFIKELIFENGIEHSYEIIFPLKKGRVRELEIDIDGQILPLSHYGSGVEQMISIATDIVRHGNKKIILIEEPEVHFHPNLQRKFIKFLNKNRNVFKHQYFIASHSSTFINEFLTMGDKIFYITTVKDEIDDGFYSQASELKSKDIEKLFNDLGVKGSDFFQTNSIIWVEGPSDKIYINKWIQLYCRKHKNELNGYMPTEGRDYQIMPYGGSVYNYLNADREKVFWEKDENNNFDLMINILSINKNAIFVMDRDNYGSNLNNKKVINEKEKKKRVLEFCEKNSLLCWMTQKKQIENYLPKTTAIFRKDELIGTYKKNKVKRALKIASELQEKSLVNYDLEERIGEIVKKIIFWNQ